MLERVAQTFDRCLHLIVERRRFLLRRPRHQRRRLCRRQLGRLELEPITWPTGSSAQGCHRVGEDRRHRGHRRWRVLLVDFATIGIAKSGRRPFDALAIRLLRSNHLPRRSTDRSAQRAFRQACAHLDAMRYAERSARCVRYIAHQAR